MSKKLFKKAYKFVHYEDVWIQTNLVGRACSLPWLEINDTGKITVKCSNPGGYAWDGCTPKVNFLDLIWGTPDGRFDNDTQKQITYYASMIHDVLYQYKAEVRVSRKETDILFRKLLEIPHFELSDIYYRAVRSFGRFSGKWTYTQTAPSIIISSCSWLNH